MVFIITFPYVTKKTMISTIPGVMPGDTLICPEMMSKAKKHPWKYTRDYMLRPIGIQLLIIPIKMNNFWLKEMAKTKNTTRGIVRTAIRVR